LLKITSLLIDQLAETSAGLPYSADRVCKLLSEIEQTGDITAVLCVYPLLCAELKAKPRGGLGGLIERLNLTTEVTGFDVPREVRAAAVCCIAQIMSTVHVEQLAEVDTRLRLYGRWSWGVSAKWANWADYAPPDPDVVLGLPGAPLALGALSTHRNGYVREAAVRLLCEDISREGFPFLLWRAADWVQEIRVLARSAVMERLADDRYLQEFVNTLPLLNRMETLHRVDLSYLVALVRSRLLDQPGRICLVAGLRSPNMHVRRASGNLLDRVLPAPDSDVIAIIAGSKDNILRLLVLKWEVRMRTTDPEAACAIRSRFLVDKSAGLRLAALRSEIEVGGPGLLELLWRYASDDAITIRECARYNIRRLAGDVNFVEYYRGVATSEPAFSPGALAGVGETGTREDYDFISGYLVGSARQRAVALKAMARLDPVRVRSAAVASILDDSGQVRRVALGIIGFRVSDDEAYMLIGRLTNATLPGAIRTLIIAARRVEEWQALDILLSAAITVSSSEAAIAAIETWNAKGIGVYGPRLLSAAERDKFRNKLSLVLNKLTPATIERLTTDIEGMHRWHY
jgi:hypothetical protein